MLRRVRVSRITPSEKKPRLTQEAIVDVALQQMRASGYDGVTLRSIARALDTGPASLYAHVSGRAVLDQLVVDRIMSSVALPAPDDTCWRAQVTQVLVGLLDAYRAHPGVARAAIANVPSSSGSLRLADHLLGTILLGDVEPRDAAWAVDVLLLYVSAVSFEESVWAAREGISLDELSQAPTLNDELETYFVGLAREHPHLSAHARLLASGTPQKRFEFGIAAILDGLRRRPAEPPQL